jgi:hypothetical protein
MSATGTPGTTSYGTDANRHARQSIGGPGSQQNDDWNANQEPGPGASRNDVSMGKNLLVATNPFLTKTDARQRCQQQFDAHFSRAVRYARQSR